MTRAEYQRQYYLAHKADIAARKRQKYKKKSSEIITKVLEWQEQNTERAKEKKEVDSLRGKLERAKTPGRKLEMWMNFNIKKTQYENKYSCKLKG